MDKRSFIEERSADWNTRSRWKGIRRTYTPEDVYRLRGSYDIDYSLARMGAGRLWQRHRTRSLLA